MNGFPELVYESSREDQLMLGPDGMSLDLLRAVYRNPSISLPVRMRAAIAALLFEVPKLQVTALVSEQNFANLLDQRLKRIAELEATPINAGKPEMEVKPSMPRVADRRYRRF